MATLNPTLKIDKVAPQPRVGGGGGGGPIRRHPGGGGGGGRDDSYPDFSEQLRRYRLGLAVGLAAVVMLFVSFTSAYIVRQGLGTYDSAAGQYVSDWRPVTLPMALLLVNTLLLLASSFTIEKARRAAFEDVAVTPIVAMPGISAGNTKRFPWLAVTVVLGLGFLTGQLLAWRQMYHTGFAISSSPASSFFYVLTGMHGLHLAGGVIALLYAGFVTFLPRSVERRRIVVDVTAWYWHFMALLWLYIFALMKFAA